LVPLEHRGKGVAVSLIGKIVEIAASLGVRVLYLQTPRLDGGLYARLGWKPYRQVRYKELDVLVMELEIEHFRA
jgi:GNAT superfamily N-acetyltransferase